jgi:coat protein VP1
MRYFLCMAVIICGLNSSFAGKKILIPGTNYCGPGNTGGKAKSQLDSACKRHDNSKGYNQKGPTKYIPGTGNAAVQKADRRLISDSAKVIASKNASKRQKATAAVVGSYFVAKNQLDRAGSRKRAKSQQRRTIYAKAKAALKRRFSRKKR